MFQKISILDSPLSKVYPARQNYTIGYRFLVATIFIFILLCLFDPADKLLGLKLPVFLFSWLVGIFVCLLRQGEIKISLGLILYVSLMILIPILSIGIYFIIDGSKPFEGFQMAKAYFFISFAILLYLSEINLLRCLSFALTMLSFAIIIVFATLLYDPSLYLSLYSFGNNYGVFYLDQRDYGSNLVMSQIYFATSPMLVIPIAYYYYKAKFSENKNLIYGAITFMNVVAMYIAGTRNNMLVSLLLPLTLYLFFTRKRSLSAILIVIIMGIFLLGFYMEIGALLDPSEVSNSTKLALINDYINVFSNPFELLFGQGLGSYYYWTGKDIYSFVTELTYFEVIRNFGLLFGSVMVFLLIYPIIYGFLLNKEYNERHIIIGYFFYLLMCFTNPNLFSSMGMLILAVVIANIFLYKKNVIKKRIVN